MALGSVGFQTWRGEGLRGRPAVGSCASSSRKDQPCPAPCMGRGGVEVGRGQRGCWGAGSSLAVKTGWQALLGRVPELKLGYKCGQKVRGPS